jgi:hypothetical protein
MYKWTKKIIEQLSIKINHSLASIEKVIKIITKITK